MAEVVAEARESGKRDVGRRREQRVDSDFVIERNGNPVLRLIHIAEALAPAFVVTCTSLSRVPA